MSNRTSIETDPAVASMASLAVHDDSSRAVADDDHTTTLDTTDPQPQAQDQKRVTTDIEAMDTQLKKAAEVAGLSTKTNLSTSSPDTSANISPDTPGNMNPDGEAACTTIQSTAPVPTIYPPRRPNIFRTRQKHLRFDTSMYGRGPVPVNTTQELEAADGFSLADLEGFQAEIKDRMKKKSEMFMNMVRQSAWQQRRVEDLGEVFAIED